MKKFWKWMEKNHLQAYDSGYCQIALIGYMMEYLDSVNYSWGMEDIEVLVSSSIIEGRYKYLENMINWTEKKNEKV
jgi:hypothetical protein